jgi:glycosyltransferase involved in cell wall biosynthesis
VETPAAELSVVVPVYRCETCLRQLYERLTRSVSEITSDYELVLVDDRSPDDGWTTLRELAALDQHVKAVRLSRNFGQHPAITAGLATSSGRWVVVMDCDLQDPPEEIRRLYSAAQQGYDIVFARRKSRRHALFRRASARVYARLMNLFLGTSIEGEYGAFSIISQRVVREFLALRDRDRHYLLILAWLGFSHTSIDVGHGERYAGRSAYSLTALIRHAANGIFFQTTTLLRWIVYVGLFTALAGFAFALELVIAYLAGAKPPSGYTSLAILVLVSTGFILTSLGVIGLYLGKVFEQVKQRPLYVIDERINLDDSAQAAVSERETSAST